MESPTGCGKKKNRGSSKAANSLELVQCKVCRAFLLCKDTDVHTAKDGICDKLISTKNPAEVLHSSFKETHGFILNGTLFCAVRKLPSKDEEWLKHLPKCIKKQLVLLHPTIMEFCKIRSGDRVAVFTSKNKWYLYHVLQSKNILPASMCFYDELALLPTPDLLMVVTYSKPLPKAAAITVQFKTQEKEMHGAHFEDFLVSQNCGVGVSPGSELSFSYLGTHPKVIIKSIVDEEGHKHEQTESAVWTKRDDDDDHSAHHMNEITSNFSAISLNNNSECQEGNGCFDDEETTREHSELVSSTPVRKLVEHLSISTEVNNSDCSINIPTFVAISQCTKIEICMTKMEPVRFPESEEELLLNKIGGLEIQINLLRKLIGCQLKFPEKRTSLGNKPQHILIYGPPGTGKTMVVKAVAQESRMNFVYINGREFFSKYYGKIGARLNKIFEDAIKSSPSILFIDEIDFLCSKKERGQSEQEKLVLATLSRLIDSLSNISNQVIVIAATNSPDSLDPVLRRVGLLDEEIEFGVPTAADRKEILWKMLAGIKHDLSANDIEEIAAAAHGFTGADLGRVCNKAVELTNDHCSEQSSDKETSSIKVTKDNMWYALKHVRPSAMREITLEVPKVYWKDIGGMHQVKKQLKQAVEWPFKHPETLKVLGFRPPCGVLLYGPPGCSKTMIAKALATESGLNFIAIKGPELFTKWVGESEKAVREVFRKAKAVAPSILFFDEIEAIAPRRGSGSGSNVDDRVLTQLLTLMDGIEPLKGVMVIAATNRPDRIDKALLRPGRLGRNLYVPLPDFETRKEIFKITMQSMSVKGVDVNELAAKTENYSGAEIVAVCDEAGVEAMEEDVSATVITKKHFDAALKVILPGTSQEEIKFYNEYSTKNV